MKAATPDEVTYRCIYCGVLWGSPLGIEHEEYSDGICPKCFRSRVDLVHRTQKREGYWDCFATADEYCDQQTCTFRFACLTSCIEEWEFLILGYYRRGEHAN
jgi:hypothetical protein